MPIKKELPRKITAEKRVLSCVSQRQVSFFLDKINVAVNLNAESAAGYCKKERRSPATIDLKICGFGVPGKTRLANEFHSLDIFGKNLR